MTPSVKMITSWLTFFTMYLQPHTPRTLDGVLFLPCLIPPNPYMTCDVEQIKSLFLKMFPYTSFEVTNAC